MTSSPLDPKIRWVCEGIRQAEEPSGLIASRYEIRKEIARGGLGIVYRAFDRQLNRPVALKMLREKRQYRTENLARFRREAQAGAAISHPNVVKIFDVGEDQGRPFLVMELLDGVPLDRCLEQKSLSIRDRLGLLEKVADGVACAHEHGIVHRDLKPGNILVTSTGESKVLDFGLAHLLAQDLRLTESGVAVGTPAYMAPEQVRGKGDITPRTDIYAMGAILYEMLSGRLPLSRGSPDQLFRAILWDRPPSPRRWNERVHPDLEAICLKALEKDPRRRYASATEFRRELLRYLAGEPIQTRPPSFLDRVRSGLAKRRALFGAVTGAVLLAAGISWGAVYRARTLEARKNREEILNLYREGRLPEARQLAERFLEKRSDPEIEAVAIQCERTLRQRGEDSERLRRFVEGPLRDVDRMIERTLLSSYIKTSAYSPQRERLEKKLADLELDTRDPILGGDGRLWACLGRGWHLAGDDEQAKVALRKAVELGSSDGAVFLSLAEILMEEASALNSAGTNPEEVKGEQRKLYEQASGLLERASRLECDSILERQILTARRAQSLEEISVVRETCRAGLRDFPDALGREVFWYLLGKISTGDEAIAAYTKALEVRHYFAFALFARAVERWRKKDIEGALADCDAAIEINPRFAEAYNARGAVRCSLGKVRQAVEDLNQATSLQPEWPGYYVNRGNLLVRLGRVKEAIRDFDRAIELRPDYAKAYVGRGKVWGSREEMEQAGCDFTQAIRFDPACDEAYYWRANALWEKNPAAALRDYDVAIRLNPKDARYYVDRGILHDAQKRWQKALLDFNHAILHDPSNPLVFRKRGAVLEESGDLAGAFRDFCRAIQLDPRDPSGYAKRGIIRNSLGDRAGAKEDWKYALRIAPEDWGDKETVRAWLEDR